MLIIFAEKKADKIRLAIKKGKKGANFIVKNSVSDSGGGFMDQTSLQNGRASVTGDRLAALRLLSRYPNPKY